MSEAPELSPVDNNTQQPVAVPQEVQAELERLRAHNQELAQEIFGYRERARTAEERAANAEKALKKQKVEGSSQGLTLDQQARLERDDELQKRVQTLETELKQRDEAFRSERIKSAAISAFNQAGAINGMHLYEARKTDLVLRDDGSVAALDGGVERSLNQYVEGLKAPGSAWAYQFQASGAKGGGSVGSQPAAGEGISNPYAGPGKDFGRAIALESGTPEEQALAARFKAEAGF